MARQTCIILCHLAPILTATPQAMLAAGHSAVPRELAGSEEEHAEAVQRLHVRLVRLLVAPPGTGLGGSWGGAWYSVAQVSGWCVGCHQGSLACICHFSIHFISHCIRHYDAAVMMIAVPLLPAWFLVQSLVLPTSATTPQILPPLSAHPPSHTQAAVEALYLLHPRPSELAAAILQQMASKCLPEAAAAGEEGAAGGRGRPA